MAAWRRRSAVRTARRRRASCSPGDDCLCLPPIGGRMHSMTLDEFRKSLSEPRVPADLPPILAALWHDGKGDWHKAHELAQDVPDPDGAWVHAFLHRKEGDAANAAYWYRRAGQPVWRDSLDQEWESIVSAFLKRASAL